jgi:hypothetical protein
MILSQRQRASMPSRSMPLDPVIGFAVVGFFFGDWLPHEYYSYACIWLLSAYLFSLSAYLGAKKITKKQRRKQKTPSKKNGSKLF